MRWSIDSADAYSLAKVRRAVIDELRLAAHADADLFALEVVLGEILSSEIDLGHFAIAVIVEDGLGGPAVHVYTQRSADAGNGTRGELRDAILRGSTVPMSIESTSQGRHYVLHLPGREVVERTR